MYSQTPSLQDSYAGEPTRTRDYLVYTLTAVYPTPSPSVGRCQQEISKQWNAKVILDSFVIQTHRDYLQIISWFSNG